MGTNINITQISQNGGRGFSTDKRKKLLHVCKVTRMRERYAQMVLTFRTTYASRMHIENTGSYFPITINRPN